MSHTCLCLPNRSWYSFIDPRGREGRRPWCEVARPPGYFAPPAEIRTCNLPITNPALYHTATSAPDMFKDGADHERRKLQEQKMISRKACSISDRNGRKDGFSPVLLCLPVVLFSPLFFSPAFSLPHTVLTMQYPSDKFKLQ